jgi:hypothetical protein
VLEDREVATTARSPARLGITSRFARLWKAVRLVARAAAFPASSPLRRHPVIERMLLISQALIGLDAIGSQLLQHNPLKSGRSLASRCEWLALAAPRSTEPMLPSPILL